MELSDELVPVLGLAEHFLAKFAVKNTDFPFALATFLEAFVEHSTLARHTHRHLCKVQVASGARAS